MDIKHKDNLRIQHLFLDKQNVFLQNLNMMNRVKSKNFVEKIKNNHSKPL